MIHRVAYRLYKEIDLPNDIMVLHKFPCTIRNCFNPDHLYLGDQKQNMKDAVEAGHTGGFTKELRDKKQQELLESIEKQVLDGFKE
jgi:hypothetical protein